MIVTIDGPAGAGKSTLARQLAERLGFEFLDTGAFFRAVTLAATRAGVAGDAPALPGLLAGLTIRNEGGQTFLNGENVSTLIRAPEITRQIQHYADKPAVRDFLVLCERQAAAQRNLVTEGRDQGTVVFPEAAVKFFLTASAEVRARRRYEEFLQQGRPADFAQVLADQQQRDAQDSSRELAPLRAAADAILVDTSDLDIPATLAVLEQQARTRLFD